MRRGAWGALLIASLLAAALAGCKTVETPPPPAKAIFYPFPPDPPRVQFLTAIDTARDVITSKRGWRFLDLIVGAPPDILESQQATLGKPYGVAVWRGRIYVCDFGAHVVKVFDLERNKFYVLGGDTPPTTAPTNLCVSDDGYKFVVESMPALIQVFDPDDNYVTTFKVKDGRPGGVAAVGGELFVTDVTNDRILVLDRGTGKLLRTLGGKGQGPGQFLMPNAIAADAQDNLYVSDHMNFRFQKVDRSDKSLISVGGAGDTYGKFARPRGIAVGPDGVIYVVESVYNVVQMFNQQGNVLMAFGNFTGAPGFLLLPASIAVDKSCMKYFAKYVDPRFEAEYLLFVTSQVGEARLGVYAFGHLKPGAEIPPLPVPEEKPKPTPEAGKPTAETAPNPATQAAPEALKPATETTPNPAPEAAKPAPEAGKPAPEAAKPAPEAGPAPAQTQSSEKP
ncbi:MAG: 6-bladed beta-propeller [Candidatus Brocadiia bacterium]